MNIKTLKEALPYLFQSNVSTMVVGHHGVGKSQAVKQFADENGYEFIDLRLGTQDVGDLLGLADFTVDKVTGEKTATKFMRPDWFPTDPNSKGIIFLDEINRGRRDVLQAVFQLCLDKRLHRYVLPKGWHVVAAMNPNTEDYIVTDLSDKAFLDRFCHIKLAPSKQEFFDYAKSRKFEPQLIQFLHDQPSLLQTELEAFDLDVKPSRRSWEAVDRLMKIKTPVNLLRELVSGLVGTAAATAFVKSLSDSDKPISGKDIVDNYEKFSARIKKYSDSKTGGRQDMLKFTCDSLLEAIQELKKKPTKDQAKNISNFLKEIPKDLSFALCQNLYLEDNVREVIDNDDDLLKILANARNMKLEDL
jgi:MoxR-like ATPase